MDSLCFTLITGAVCSILIVILLGDANKEDEDEHIL